MSAPPCGDADGHAGEGDQGSHHRADKEVAALETVALEGRTTG
jgi:hypothetical protein